MGVQADLETAMDKYLVKDAPVQIPESGRKALVQYVPIISLIGGILSLIAALGLWRLAHRVNEIANSVNEFARAYGVDTSYNRVDYGIVFYVAFAMLLLQGLLMFAAYPHLKAHKKRGWDLLLFSVVANFLYGVIYAFTDSGSFFNVFGSIIGAIIGLYLLAQIKSYYNGKAPVNKAAVPPKTK